jgi:hypothetical protein
VVSGVVRRAGPPCLDLRCRPANATWTKLHGRRECTFGPPALEGAPAEARETGYVPAGQPFSFVWLSHMASQCAAWALASSREMVFQVMCAACPVSGHPL